MDKLLFLILVFLIALFFYLLIPAIGAILARDNWKRFRLRLFDVALFPVLDSTQLDLSGRQPPCYRFFGTIEAIQGENRIWINNGHFTLAADMQDTPIYMLPSISGYEHDRSAGGIPNAAQNFEPTIVNWNQLFSIAEGTQIFLAGELHQDSGRPVFKSSEDCPLIVVIYDGDKRTILERAILCGRQRNEYWNQFTLASLISGMVSLLLFSYLLLLSTELRAVSLFSLSLGLLPVAIFLPPGLVLLYYYRHFWTRARSFRAGRDLVLLPLHYFRNSKYLYRDRTRQIALLADHTEYVMHKGTLEENLALVENPAQLKLRRCFYSEQQLKNSPETYLFGQFHEDKKGYRIVLPDDPMLELVLLPGQPEKIIQDCQKRSSFMVFFAGLLLTLDIMINFVIILMILRLYI